MGRLGEATVLFVVAGIAVDVLAVDRGEYEDSEAADSEGRRGVCAPVTEESDGRVCAVPMAGFSCGGWIGASSAVWWGKDREVGSPGWEMGGSGRLFRWDECIVKVSSWSAAGVERRS